MKACVGMGCMRMCWKLAGVWVAWHDGDWFRGTAHIIKNFNITLTCFRPGHNFFHV